MDVDPRHARWVLGKADTCIVLALDPIQNQLEALRYPSLVHGLGDCAGWVHRIPPLCHRLGAAGADPGTAFLEPLHCSALPAGAQEVVIAPGRGIPRLVVLSHTTCGGPWRICLI